MQNFFSKIPKNLTQRKLTRCFSTKLKVSGKYNFISFPNGTFSKIFKNSAFSPKKSEFLGNSAIPLAENKNAKNLFFTNQIFKQMSFVTACRGNLVVVESPSKQSRGFKTQPLPSQKTNQIQLTDKANR